MGDTRGRFGVTVGRVRLHAQRWLNEAGHSRDRCMWRRRGWARPPEQSMTMMKFTTKTATPGDPSHPPTGRQPTYNQRPVSCPPCTPGPHRSPRQAHNKHNTPKPPSPSTTPTASFHTTRPRGHRQQLRALISAPTHIVRYMFLLREWPRPSSMVSTRVLAVLSVRLTETGRETGRETQRECVHARSV